ncbi:MAG: UvrD-helicase domain-containing protein [Candidatus Sumerlaeia bacterium]
MNPVPWTPTQRAAIDHRDGNLVVSASAGAGKTAVLTERVLGLLTDVSGGRPPRLDEMLIITFTEKAARQMRERIEERLRAALHADPDRRPLRQALDGLGNAWIMTIDAFCRRVVLEHFHRADLPPNPRVADSSELAELEFEAIDRAAESWASAPGRRAELAGLTIALGGDQRNVAETVRRLIHFLESLDRPERWRARALARIEKTLAAGRYADLPEATDAAEACARGACEIAGAWRAVIPEARAMGGGDNLLADWKESADRLGGLVNPAAPFACDELDAILAEEFDPVLGKITNKGVCGPALFKTDFSARELEPLRQAWGRWRERWFDLDEAGLLRGARLAASHAKMLFELADQAADLIRRQKLRRSIVTFNDFERHTLNILSDPEADAPSEIAQQYRARFKTVLVDEYQDTSPLQDAIVGRVANEDDPGNLFLVGDYKQSIYRFRHADPLLLRAKLEDAGRFRHISLAENFRSRPELIEFVNACFERLMDRDVGEVDYRGGERLVAGRAAEPSADPVRVEAAWLPRRPGEAEAESEGEEAEDAAEILEGVDAQAGWVARRIRALIAETGRPAGDFAILLRSIRGELDRWTLALASEGLKVRAPGVNPLFTTQELLDLRAALSVADNPLEDLWLATLMRSPLGGFSDDDLLRIRLARPRGHFHESLLAAAGRAEPGGGQLSEDLATRLDRFMAMIDGWREAALRVGPLDLLDRILRETAYESWLAGRPEARVRLENVQHLRRLIPRFASAENGANPLARFLTLIDRAAANEEIEELPETVGDTTDCVNILTVHKSKGLEFPVVVVPRLEKRLQHASSYGPAQMDREAGLALVGVDPETRRQYRTLAWHRLRDVIERKDRSEELRLLYVAMTRARDRLILVAQRDASDLEAGARPGLGALARLHAACSASLVAPIVSMNRAEPWLLVHDAAGPIAAAGEVERPILKQALSRTAEPPDRAWRDAIAELRAEAGAAAGPAVSIELMPPVDPAAALGSLPAKTTVTQLRRVRDERKLHLEDELFTEPEMLGPAFTRESTIADRRPAWLAGEIKIDAAARGSWTHALLAHVPLDPAPEVEILKTTMRGLVEQGLIETGPHPIEAVLDSVDFNALAWFFATDLGRYMLERRGAVSRELPFSARRPIFDLDPAAAAGHPAELFLLQGVIDAVIDDGDGATLIDYKTDFIKDEQALNERIERHRLQVEMYSKCLKSIWNLKTIKTALVFLNARRVIWIED